MKTFRRFLSVCMKEMRVQSRFRFSMLTRFLISPMVSVATAGLLFSGFFRRNAETSLGDVTATNYKAHLLVGLLLHTCLNSTVYGLSSRVARESEARTLPLLWVSPGNRIFSIFGLACPDLVRCAVVALIGFFALTLMGKVGWMTIASSLTVLALVVLMGLMIGFVRACLIIGYEGVSEIGDQIYLAFVFTGCLYIPKSLLPGFLQPICEISPLYHATMMMKGIMRGEPVAHQAVVFATGLAAFAALLAIFWFRARARVIERTPV